MHIYLSKNGIAFWKIQFNFLPVRTNNAWHSFIVPDCTKNKNKNKYFSHPFDCHKFYKCAKSKLIERDCNNGRQWDQLNSSCELLKTCEAGIPKVPPFARRMMQHIPNSGVQTKNNIKKNCDDDDVADDSGDEVDYMIIQNFKWYSSAFTYEW